MQITNRDGVPINSLEDWKQHGAPVSEGHWKPGRSAYELAQDWIEGTAQQDVVALLSHRPELAGLALTQGVSRITGIPQVRS